MKRLAISIFLFCICVAGFAQVDTTATKSKNTVKDSLLVTGIVVDEDGEPWIGVTISEEGDKERTTMSDIDGNFRFRLSRPDALLKFSYIGCHDAIVSKENAKRVVLKEDEEAMKKYNFKWAY